MIEVFKLARSRDTIDLAIGTPRFPDLSPQLVEAASRALRGGHNQYEDPAGHSLFRLRIAEAMTAATDPDTEITVTAGATEALLVALLATVDPGDEVIVLTPGFEQFTTTIDIVGATPRFVRLHAPDWRYDSADLAAAFNTRTRAILLNSPSNPTGRVLDRQELDDIAVLCERWNTTVICDEVYAAYVFDGTPHLSVADVPGLAERSVVIGSWSKSHAVSGWRLGFLRADPERTEAFRRVHQLTTLGTAAPLQVAAAQAAGSVDVDAAREGMAARRDLAQDIFSQMGMKFATAEGGCYLFADFSSLVEGPPDSLAYVRGLMERTGVLLTPGTAFFADPALGEPYVRIAFNRPMETLHAAARSLLAA
ncbi:pyridoxal phosphate-dependent aminotransferase [Streptomyces sp. CB09001]|uniref:pyridoxal phosphate-dependent aminotransferase n=1 Tax=Streptomyces sp. CB09001 TaxID=2083284 RepID=UPI000E216E43|nr:pyridoxal phosphate-dependent aminotransferase [Streptomyces sp. CB09001]AXL87373.1 pyridoxal phosphate-dependent aminotransferase [Streptomyces sp. CB09001]